MSSSVPPEATSTRRDFLRGVGAVGAASLLSPRYLHAKEKLQSAEGPTDPVPRRRYGRTEEMISLIGRFPTQGRNPSSLSRWASAFSRSASALLISEIASTIARCNHTSSCACHICSGVGGTGLSMGPPRPDTSLR